MSFFEKKCINKQKYLFSILFIMLAINVLANEPSALTLQIKSRINALLSDTIATISSINIDDLKEALTKSHQEIQKGEIALSENDSPLALYRFTEAKEALQDYRDKVIDRVCEVDTDSQCLLSTIAQPLHDRANKLLALIVQLIDETISPPANRKPLANAGPDQTVPLGSNVQLDASASTDPEGNPISYQWSIFNLPPGSTAALSDVTLINPLVLIDKAGTYDFSLIVNDGVLNSNPDHILVTTANSAPVAIAGPDQTVLVGQQVTLDGSASNDVDGDLINYSWLLTSIPAGSLAVLSDPSIAMPTFTIDKPGDYVARLIVNDGKIDSAAVFTTITTKNSPPVANAGPKQTVFVGDQVQLDGSGSSDVDGDPLSFAWSLTTLPTGSTAILSPITAVNPTFVIDIPGTYLAQLMVNDGLLDSTASTVSIVTKNSPPIANPGTGQTVLLNQTVLLDGSQSNDADGDPLTYSWSMSSTPTGSIASLTGQNTANPSFTVDLPGMYIVQLIVNDGTINSSPVNVTLTTQNSRPVADAGVPATIIAGDTVTLDGSASSDADGDTLVFNWALTTRPTGSLSALSDPTIFNPSFSSDLVGDYIAQLIVNDGILDSAPATVMITANANSLPVITSNPILIATVGQPYQYTVIATDADGDALSYALTTFPAGMSIDSLTGQINWTPSLAGNEAIVVQVTDARGGSTTQAFNIVASFAVIPPPVIASFSPPSGSIGTLVTLTGSNFAPVVGSNPVVTMANRGGGTIKAPSSGFSNTQLTFTVPPGATTGSFTVTVGKQSVATLQPFTVTPVSTFSLQAAPATSQLIQGKTTTYSLRLSSLNKFSQLAVLNVTGLPLGITASLNPQQITAGEQALLTLIADPAQPLGLVNFNVSVSATVQGINQADTVALNVDVVPVTTSFLGRTVINDAQQTPLPGVTVTLLGQDGNGNATGCTGQTVADAAGNFMFTNLPAACTGGQLIRYDGLTATLPGQYASVFLSYNIVPNQVTESPVLINLPRIDNAETVMIQQNAATDQSFSFQTIPNLEITVYAGTVLTMPDGTQPNPFPMNATQIPVDRLPDAMPQDPNFIEPFFVSFQPSDTKASQPVAISYPNIMGTAPGTTMPLISLDPTKGVMLKYGTGTVSLNGTQVVPDIDPFTGQRYGIVNFDWGGQQNQTPTEPPEEPRDKLCTGTDRPIQLSSCMNSMSNIDIQIKGPRGVIGIQRNYNNFSTALGRFGRSTRDNYSYSTNLTITTRRDILRICSRTPGGAAIPCDFSNLNLALRTPDSNTPIVFSFGYDHPSADLFLLPNPAGSATVFRDSIDIPMIGAAPADQGVIARYNRDTTVDIVWKDKTVFHFSSTGQFLSSTDLNGNQTNLSYDNASRLIEITDPVGRKLRLAYDTANRVTTVTDPIGRTVQYTYNLLGAVETVTDPDGNISRYEYKANPIMLNQAVSVVRATDARGVITEENIYDSNERVIEQRMPDGGRLLFDYTLANIFTPLSPVIRNTLTDAMNHVTSYRFDPQGFLLDATDFLGRKRVFERDPSSQQVISVRGNGVCVACGNPAEGFIRQTYDANGNQLTRKEIRTDRGVGDTTSFTYEPAFNKVATTTDALGNVTQFNYDVNGNLLNVTDPKGNVTTLTYNSFGQVSTITDALGQSTLLEYDAAGNLSKVTDSLGQVTSFLYDPVSRLIQTTDANGQISRIAYDKLNRIISTTDPSGGVTRMTYDAVGNLTSLTDAKAQTTRFAYDSMNRVISRTDPLGQVETFAYDFNGNLTQHTDRKGQISSFSYDEVDRLISETYADGATVRRSYDAAGRLIEIDDSEGGITALSYDISGRLLQTISPTGTIDYQYDALNRVISRQAAGDAAVNYSYDSAGNMTTLGTAQDGIDFAYDAINRVISQNRSNGVTSAYSYDVLSRLTALKHNQGATVLDAQTYTYDPAGNRTDFHTELGQNLITQPSLRTVDGANRLLSLDGITYSYDANGNRMSETGPGGTTLYTWDARNRLKAVTAPNGKVTLFVYDALGNLVTREVTDPTAVVVASQEFLVDDLSNVVQISDSAGRQASVLTGRSIDSHLAVIDASGQSDFVFGDAINSTLATTDENGALKRQFGYEPFGETTTAPNEDFLFQYTGRVPVVENLYYYRARFYDPKAGRFLSEDPIGLRGGNANLYGYVANRPTTYIDPTGLSWFFGAPFPGPGYVETQVFKETQAVTELAVKGAIVASVISIGGVATVALITAGPEVYSSVMTFCAMKPVACQRLPEITSDFLEGLLDEQTGVPDPTKTIIEFLKSETSKRGGELLRKKIKNKKKNKNRCE